MSGGHFNYDQYKIGYIADEVEQLIEENSNEKEEYKFSEETIARFREAWFALKKAQIYAQRIDWLVSGDDGEDSFHRRLKEELKELMK
jgi:hypothetical protein